MEATLVKLLDPLKTLGGTLSSQSLLARRQPLYGASKRNAGFYPIRSLLVQREK